MKGNTQFLKYLSLESNKNKKENNDNNCVKSANFKCLIRRNSGNNIRKSTDRSKSY